MANPWHVGWLSEGVKKWNKRRRRIKFTPDLSGVRFFEHLPPDFRDDPKTSRFFEKIDLSDADLSNADLSDSNFFQAKFSNANLTNANLSKSNFSKALFRKANLSNCTFSGSLLRETEFVEANLLQASFEDAQLESTLFIATEISSDQREEISSQSMAEYATLASYARSKEVADSIRKSSSPATALVQPDEIEVKRPKKNRYEVFFGTTRNPIFERGAISDFGVDQWESTNYGIAEIIVPDGNRLGGIGKTLWRRLFNR